MTSTYPPWRPIADAPKDDVPVLVSIAGGEYHAVSAVWSEECEAWVFPGSRFKLLVEPTHFMDLPEPPDADATP